MTKLLKKLIPTLATIGCISTPAAVLSSCSCTSEKYKAFPKEYLDIDGTTLLGFKDEYKTLDKVEGYERLTIPKEITKIDNAAFTVGSREDDSGKAIKKIDFEKGCLCTIFGVGSFSGCLNLETVVLPPKFETWTDSLFSQCSNLTTIDMTNIEEKPVIWLWWPIQIIAAGWPTSGLIIYKSNNKTQEKYANSLANEINTHQQGYNWQAKAK